MICNTRYRPLKADKVCSYKLEGDNVTSKSVGAGGRWHCNNTQPIKRKCCARRLGHHCRVLVSREFREVGINFDLRHDQDLTFSDYCDAQITGEELVLKKKYSFATSRKARQRNVIQVKLASMIRWPSIDLNAKLKSPIFSDYSFRYIAIRENHINFCVPSHSDHQSQFQN
nr:hypothetical protein [Rhodobacter sp. CZR27]